MYEATSSGAVVNSGANCQQTERILYSIILIIFIASLETLYVSWILRPLQERLHTIICPIMQY